MRKYGWKRDKRDDRDYRFCVPRRVLKALPDEADAFKDVFLPAYDQGRLGSCTGQAWAKHYQFNLIKQKLGSWIPSRLFIYFNERLDEGTWEQDAGAMLRTGAKTLAAQGVCPEEEWKYDIEKFVNRPPKECYDHALEHQAEMYQRVNPNLEEMMGCMAQGFPFVCGIQIFSSFDTPEVEASGDVPMPHKGWSRWHFGGESLLGGHAILVHAYSQPKQKFYWVNSYGYAWGRKGCGTLPFAYLADQEICDDRWTLRLVEQNK